MALRGDVMTARTPRTQCCTKDSSSRTGKTTKASRSPRDDHVRQHAAYLAGLVGWGHVGIGSDLDGGIGLEESPVEVDTIANLYKVGDVVPVVARQAMLGGNWLNFLRSALPATA